MTILWTPPDDRAAASRMRAFADFAAERHGRSFPTYDDLHGWSVAEPGPAWSAVWDFCGVIGDKGDRAVLAADDLVSTRFFPDADLNFAENLLVGDDRRPAIVFRREDGAAEEWTLGDLRREVAAIAGWLRSVGVSVGDRVAAWLPNAPQTYAVMLATTSIGATFSSTSPDFGVDGVVDRFGQIEPSVLFAVDGYVYNGRRHDCLDRLPAVAARLPSVRHIAVLGFAGGDDGASRPALGDDRARWYDDVVGAHRGPNMPEFERFPFDHPLYVLYSSGTTGAPKCIVHRAGGVLLKHLSEQQLHCDVRVGDRVFYFTTAGWMMWNWLASALASQATLIVFDGAPTHPTPTTLFDLADEVGITLFGTSAKFIDGLRKGAVSPRDTHDLTSVRTITSTGSPLVPEGFDHVYEHIKADVHLASISGGTDLCGCLVAGDPTSPVRRGEIQAPALGLAIDVFDPDGHPVPPGTHGELVCTNAFPSMPLRFWGDDDGSRYRAAYFDRFPGVWHQGDFAEWTPAGGMVITGRSDATLNPGGVRIGTAEIYRQVEQLDEVVEALVIGQRWDDDTRIVLFVVLADGAELDDDLVATIRRKVRQGASPRHVPAVVVAVDDLPRTRSGKLTELAVRDVVEGRPVHNVEALANPEALDAVRDLPELQR